jgi:hypothetical protein
MARSDPLDYGDYEKELAAYDAGYEARKAGAHVDDNPYKQGTREDIGMLRRRWFDGWYDCKYWQKYFDPLWEREIG